MKAIVYHLGARLDVLEIVEYYEREGGAQLADHFTSELERFIEAVAERPNSYREHPKGIRRANLDQFPHHVLFRIVNAETVKILSVKHDKRRPSYGMHRR